MGQKLPYRSAHSDLVDQELRILLKGATRYENLEAALRLRALGEMAEALGTDDLLELAARVCAPMNRDDQSISEDGTFPRCA